MNFANKTAAVLGGTSGIGLATAIRLRELGATVVVAGRSAENLASARDLGFDAHAVDVLDRDALTQFFAGLNSIDLLVNSATGGGRAVGPFLEMDLDGFQGSFRKLWGYTNSVQLAAPYLNEHASIVLVSGAPARRARPGQSALSSVGGAVEAFVRAVASELAPARINVVSPGVIDTPLISGGEQRDSMLAKATQKYAVPRPGSAEEVAKAIVFALDNEFVTGTTIDVDGGWLLA